MTLMHVHVNGYIIANVRLTHHALGLFAHPQLSFKMQCASVWTVCNRKSAEQSFTSTGKWWSYTKHT